MEIKRRKQFDFYVQIKRFAIKKIKKAIKRAEDSVIDDWGNALILAPLNEVSEIEYEISNRQFVAKSRIVKRSFREFSGIPKVKEFLEKNYNRELRYSRAEWFPLKWMERDKKIMAV